MNDLVMAINASGLVGSKGGGVGGDGIMLDMGDEESGLNLSIFRSGSASCRLVKALLILEDNTFR